ncbi:MAG: hypothetical protein MRY83_21590 [Flavobacteriales bacterium]|nr:hypothetical protein [Flavobacteriales bacterium]
MLRYIVIILTVILGLGESWAQQYVGVGTTNPTNPLHISPITPGQTDPLRIDDLQPFQIGDSTVLVVNPNQGSVRYMSFQDLSNVIQIENIDSLIQTQIDSSLNDLDLYDSIVNIIYNNGDTLLYNLFFTDSITHIVMQNILIDTTFINMFTDQSNIDSADLSGFQLTLYEDTSIVSVDLSSISDSATNFVFQNLLDSIINNATLIATLRDSINSDDQILDSVVLNGQILTIHLENSPPVSANIGSLDTDVDSMNLSGNMLNLFENGNSIQVDLSSLISTDTDIDSASITGKILSIFENSSTVSVDLSNISSTLNIRTETSDYSATLSDHVIFVDATTGNIRITLPDAAANPGKEYRIKKIDCTENIIEVTAFGGLVDKLTLYTSSRPCESKIYVSDGTNWYSFD